MEKKTERWCGWQAATEQTDVGTHRWMYASIPTQTHKTQLWVVFFVWFFYLLAGADGRGNGALRASSLHLDWLGAFKHGRRLEVTARQKRAGSWVCQSKFLSNTLKKVGDQWGRVWREQPIPRHACSFCAAEALVIGINWTATVGQENYLNIISIWN